MIENIRRDLGVGQGITPEMAAADDDHQQLRQERESGERDRERNLCQVTGAARPDSSPEGPAAALLVLADTYPMFLKVA